MIKNLFNNMKEEKILLLQAESSIENTGNLKFNAFLISVFIMSAPVVLFANLFIMHFSLFASLLMITALLLITFLLTLIRIFYYQQIKEKTDIIINYKVLILSHIITDILFFVLTPIIIVTFMNLARI